MIAAAGSAVARRPLGASATAAAARRCKSAAAAPAASASVKNFKIYRWDPNEKVCLFVCVFVCERERYQEGAAASFLFRRVAAALPTGAVLCTPECNS